ncbi:MAG: hypothetical protein ACI9EZ_001589 [Halobacteriales archaeon]
MHLIRRLGDETAAGFGLLAHRVRPGRQSTTPTIKTAAEITPVPPGRRGNAFNVSLKSQTALSLNDMIEFTFVGGDLLWASR